MDQSISSQVDTSRSLYCPDCKKPLTLVLKEDIDVHACSSCEGIWVDAGDEKILLHIKPEVFTVEELRNLRKFYTSLGVLEEVRYRKCPVCCILMNRVNWGGLSGVIVDKCAQDGAWYQKGEVEKICEYIALGGIEYEKLKLSEYGLANVNSRLTSEVIRLDKKIDSAYFRARLYHFLGI